jgi:mRNA-degrading endonuclease RelE of RelBE toxin-antitoxin system
MVQFTSAARRDIASIPRNDADVILSAISAFDCGALPNADVVKLRGHTKPTWRLRVGKWRVRYRREHNAMIIVSIGDRKDVYR